MIQLNKMNGNVKVLSHHLRPKFQDELFPSGGMNCYIQKMSSGKYAVFPMAPSITKSFYKVYDSIDDLENNFDEE